MATKPVDSSRLSLLSMQFGNVQSNSIKETRIYYKMSSTRYENVRNLLEYYDKCQRRVDSYKTIIREFLETLQSNYNSKQNLAIKIRQFYRVGSSYEETVVHPQADFDIGMVLSCPCNMEFFSARKADESGLYSLKKVPGSSFSFPNLLNYSNFLKVEELKHKVCNDLLSVLKSMTTTQGFKIHHKETYSGVKVELKKQNHEILTLDIIPQIEGDPKKDLPDWNGDNIPKFMKDIIEEKKLGVYFTLSAPPEFKKEQKEKSYGCGGGGGGGGFGSSNDNRAELIVQANFTIIEKETLLGVSDTVVDAIRISKGLLFCNPFLKSGGLRSFQIKRVALKHVKEIDNTKDSFCPSLTKVGNFKFILIVIKNEEECEKLGKRLRSIFQEIGPQNVLKHLVTDWDFYRAPE
ncbi:hypothetical protein Anas_09230 [Armadillidium nasatum]|uniref:Uncharacterized protein n=1 Tax=Armadillidium nasatum TaxID=96803 RepID=A0A5N5T4Z1_9CRUS|nr:hypothetical protein Anas_09230 [Armadillidium nasatum]